MIRDSLKSKERVLQIIGICSVCSAPISQISSLYNAFMSDAARNVQAAGKVARRKDLHNIQDSRGVGRFYAVERLQRFGLVEKI